MGDYTAISDVGETMISLLQEQMKDLISDKNTIVLISPGEVGASDAVRLSLFLYQVDENPYLKNRPVDAMATELPYPALPLDLAYMVTAYPSPGIQDRTERSKEEHQVLGRAIQVFHDNAVVYGTMLKGNLASTAEELHITMTHLSMDDMTKIWTTFQDKPFRPSICYLVTPVMIDSLRSVTTQRVVKREMDYGTPSAGKGA